MTLDELDTSSRLATIGMIDDPAGQRRIPLTWSPEDGHLLFVGLPGSGTTTALGTLAVALARVSVPPDVYVVGADAALDPVAHLENVGAVVPIDDDERLVRLLWMLADRQSDDAGGGGRPRAVLLVDGLDALLASTAEMGAELEALLTCLFSGGAGSGMSIVGTVRRAGGLPQRILSMCPGRLLFRLADRYDYRALGSSRELIDPVPGRALQVRGDRDVQVALPHARGLAAAVAATRLSGADPARRPPGVAVLPTNVEWADLSPNAQIQDGAWLLPVGIEDRHRRCVEIRLEPGVGALVVGPTRSGKTTTLATIAAGARMTGLEVVAIAPRRSGLHSALAGVVDDEGDAISRIECSVDRVLVLVDDADQLDLPNLMAMSAADPTRVRVVAAAQTAQLRRSYGSWAARLGEGGIGLLLDARRHDGELLGVALPESRTRRTPGRGWLVNRDHVQLVQIALPPT